jgi:hypothetical protein
MSNTPGRRRPKPTTTAHQRRLKAARNRRYYVRQRQRDPRSKRENKARVYPLILLDSEAADLAIDVDFEKGDKGKILRKFGYRAVIGSVAVDLVRDRLKKK